MGRRLPPASGSSVEKCMLTLTPFSAPKDWIKYQYPHDYTPFMSLRAGVEASVSSPREQAKGAGVAGHEHSSP